LSEYSGAFGQEAMALLALPTSPAASGLYPMSPRPEPIYLLQRISMIIQQGNAAAVLGTMHCS